MNWLKYKKFYFSISALLVGVSLFSLVTWGLRPGIDFTGGTLIELTADKKAGTEEPEDIIFKEKIEVQSVQRTEDKGMVIKTEFIPQKKAEEIRQALESTQSAYTIERFETVGPTLGKELLKKTLTAAVLAVLGMLFYIAWAFKNIRFGAAAVLALLHDTLILTGAFSLLGHFYGVEIDALFVTAVLTTMSFSVHDTVVVFNKIREKTQIEMRNEKWEQIANEALSETMVRSINNSLTIAFMLLALLFLGGATIRWFISALFVGTVLGTYSSPFVAVPILGILQRQRN